MSAAPVPPPPQHSRNTALWWILGILGAGIVVLALAGVIVTAYLARQVHIREAGKRVEIETPVGDLKVNTAGTHDTGLPIYPGAVSSESQGGNVSFSTDNERVGISAEHFRSSDPLERVQTWYRKRLGPEFRQEGPNEKGRPGRKDHLDMGEHDLAFVNDAGEGARIVALKRVEGGTEIDLVRVGKQEVQ